MLCADPIGRQFFGSLNLRGSLVTTPDATSRQLVAAAACLLDQGRAVDGLSRLLTAAALLVLMLPAVFPASTQRLPAAILVAAALLGTAETLYAVRVGLDAALFHRLAEGPGPLDLDGIDTALIKLGLIAVPRADGSASSRVGGARRLLYRQSALLVLQVGLILAAAALAALR
jgi:hypothetical protein